MAKKQPAASARASGKQARSRQFILIIGLLLVVAGLVWWANQANRPPVVTISTPTPGVTPTPSATPIDLSTYPQQGVSEADVWRVTFHLRDQNEGPVNFEWTQSKTLPLFPPENQSVLVNGSVMRFTIERFTNQSTGTTIFERVETKNANGSVTVTGKRTSCTQTQTFPPACGDSYDPAFAELAKRQADTVKTFFFGFNTTRAQEDAAVAKIPGNAYALWTGTKQLYGQSCERYALSGDLDDCFDPHGWILWLRGPSVDTRVRILP